MLLALLLYLLSVLYFYFRVLKSFMLAVLFFMTLSNKNTPYSVKEEIYQHFPIPNICEKTHNTQNSIKETLLGLTLQIIINTIILRNFNAPFSQISHLKTKQNPQILKEFS